MCLTSPIDLWSRYAQGAVCTRAVLPALLQGCAEIGSEWLNAHMLCSDVVKQS